MNTINLQKYFTTRNGLWVSSSLAECFDLGSVEKTSIKNIASHKLGKYMSEKDIIKEYGVTDCTLDQIAQLIDKQKNGEQGMLITSGYSNIFYVQGKDTRFAVSVCWHSDDSEWSVVVWKLAHNAWFAGSVVFSCNPLETQTITLGHSDTLTLAIQQVKDAGYKVIKEM